tara:strand:- start:255 stop:842 length:588 start_codon:yes stop_codon:yes gene_type:complete
MKEKISNCVSFVSMDQGTKSDYELLKNYEKNFAKKLPNRIISSLKKMDIGLQGYQVTRLQHSLQTATRAEVDGADIELIVAALIHDIGDDLSPHNHSQVASAIIKPYVREEVTWILEKHGIFQMFYYADKIGLNKHERERYRSHKWYNSCKNFCSKWDQTSFDPDCISYPLEHFEPMIKVIFTRPPFDPYYVKDN